MDKTLSGVCCSMEIGPKCKPETMNGFRWTLFPVSTQKEVLVKVFRKMHFPNGKEFSRFCWCLLQVLGVLEGESISKTELSCRLDYGALPPNKGSCFSSQHRLTDK